MSELTHPSSPFWRVLAALAFVAAPGATFLSPAYAQSAAACDAARQQGRILRGCPGTRRPPVARPPVRNNQRPPTRPAAARPNPVALPPGAIAIRDELAAISPSEWMSDNFGFIQPRVLALGTLEDLRTLAESGNPRAQRLLGGFLQTGSFGAPQDSAQGLEWFRRAAAGGDPRAQFSLGLRLLVGEELPRDDPTGMRLLAGSAAQGYPLAQYQMGVILYHGRYGVPQDQAQGLIWLRRSAAAGYELARGELRRLNSPVQ